MREKHEKNTKEIKSQVDVSIPGNSCGCMFFARSARQTDTTEPKSIKREDSASAFKIKPSGK